MSWRSIIWLNTFISSIDVFETMNILLLIVENNTVLKLQKWIRAPSFLPNNSANSKFENRNLVSESGEISNLTPSWFSLNGALNVIMRGHNQSENQNCNEFLRINHFLMFRVYFQLLVPLKVSATMWVDYGTKNHLDQRIQPKETCLKCKNMIDGGSVKSSRFGRKKI